jgi:hypothetical protein
VVEDEDANVLKVSTNPIFGWRAIPLDCELALMADAPIRDLLEFVSAPLSRTAVKSYRGGSARD